MPRRVVKPTGKCAVCKHPERVRIELERAQGAAVRAIARKYGINHYAVHRHWHKHVSDERKSALVLGPVHRQALAARVAEESESALDHFKAVRAGLYQLYDAAVTAGDGVGGAMLSGRLHENFMQTAKLTGQIASSPLLQQTTINNFFASPDYQRLANGLLALARSRPEVRPDILAMLRELEMGQSTDQQMPESARSPLLIEQERACA